MCVLIGWRAIVLNSIAWQFLFLLDSISSPSTTQRPTVKELLKHKFIAKAKKTSYLVELIDRHRKWKEGGGKDDSDSDDDSDAGYD
jgi:serine/threonine-protein kinase 24/25/MST4